MELIESGELDEIRDELAWMRNLLYACKPVCGRLIERLDRIEEQLNVWEFRLKYHDDYGEEYVED